jgi:hypothetical protein
MFAASAKFEKRDLNSFVATERAIALEGALNNIGPDGLMVPGAGAGFVIASPSQVNPDCQYLNLSPASSTDTNRFLHLDSRLGHDIEDAY